MNIEKEIFRIQKLLKLNSEMMANLMGLKRQSFQNIKGGKCFNKKFKIWHLDRLKMNLKNILEKV